jgi:hypothetical protein
MSLFETIMLICFGAGWPFSITKTVRTKIVTGKSPWFLGIVATGYASGIIHKILYSQDFVLALYITNFLMVCIDLGLYLKLSKTKKPYSVTI